MNIENFRAVLAYIKTHPDEWNQQTWHCGTVHCLAGHAQIMAGKAADTRTVRRDARVWLDLSSPEADYLVASRRTLQDFEAVAENGMEAAYSCDGRDRDGFDRDGYNRNGCNRAVRDGYNRNGCNHDGIDHDGLDHNNRPLGEETIK